EGGKAAVAEAARNIACTGARPLGITDCLNFGSPERPSVFYQFKESCRGIAEACRALDTPVTGGNVSFYNESPAGAVDPTPVVGMVGLLARADRAVPSHARAAGDVVFALGETRAELGASQLWEALHGFVGGQPPRVDLAAERRLVDYLVAAAERGLLRSAHDCSQGGIGVALAEVAMGGAYDETGFGLDLDLTTYGLGLAAADLLFSESHGRAVVTCQPERATAALFASGYVTRLSSTPSTVSDRYISRAYPDAWEIDGKMCGIIGVTGVPDAARVAYLGLYSLQHRGQESGGMVVVDGEGVARSHRGMGLVSDIFNERVLSDLPGDVAIGHTRYSTAGTSVLANAQPMLARYREGPLALAHNGNLTNAVQL